MSEEEPQEPAEDRREEDPQSHFIPTFGHNGTANTTLRDMRGVQAQTINGPVTVLGEQPNEPADLVVRRLTADETTGIGHRFVPPAGFHDAGRILAKHNVVVLWGRGSGRSFAARRLLVDSGADAVCELDPQRELATVRRNDLEPESGYVWDLRDSGDRPFTDAAFTQCRNAFGAAGCRLVITLDDRSQCSREGLNQAVQLRPPDPAEVAISVVDARYRKPDGRAQLTLKRDLLDVLEAGDPPEKAVRAAELAIRVTEKEIEVADALTHLCEDVSDAVDRWFEGRTVTEYSMALSVAVMENRSYGIVADAALRLEERIRTAQVPEDKAPRPRRVFDSPKERLLRDVRASTTVREHPRHTGLTDETISFDRQDWGPALLRHAWREYQLLQPIVQDWLRDEVFFSAAKRALSSIIKDVPATRPMWFVNQLASSRRESDRLLARMILVDLAQTHDLAPLVHRTLREWTKGGGAFLKATAASVHSSAFGSRDLGSALEHLAEIGCSEYRTAQGAVVEGILHQLQWYPERGERVLRTVVEWSGPNYRREALHTVSLSIALWLTGLLADRFIQLDQVAESHPSEVRALMRRVMSDSEFGAMALEHLSYLALKARWDGDAAEELVRLAELITPDLRWWARRAKVTALTLKHPGRSNEIRHVFRVARRHQRRQSRLRITEPSTTPPARDDVA